MPRPSTNTRGEKRGEKREDLGELGLHQLAGQLLIKDDLESERWYHAQPEWPAASPNGLKGTKAQWNDLAIEALSAASRMYEKRVNAPGDAARRALDKEHTFGDKVAACALAIQESPLHRLDELRNLLELSQRKSRHESAQALDTLKDLFVNDLLPDDRRLISLRDRDCRCDHKALTKRHLVYALFESELKTVYREFIQVLEDCGRDTVIYVKHKSVKLIYDLLVAKPENEKVLLFMLVGKIGDLDRRVSSSTSFNLSNLLQKHHPQMRVVVVREVEQMLRRPNIKRRAQYNAVNFLNQLVFTDEDHQLARDVVHIYMDLFTDCVTEKTSAEVQKPAKKGKEKKRLHDKKAKKKKEEAQVVVSEEIKNSRLMSALLLGVNRAFPFTKPEQDDTTYEKYYNPLFRVSHAESVGSATQALALLLQVSQANATQNDRLYRALYSRVQDVAEASDTIQASFLNVIFKAMKDDTNPKRVKAFVKRLLQAGSYGSSGFAGACMVVVSECFRSGQTGVLKSFVSIPELDDDEEMFFDADASGKEVGTMEIPDSDSDDDASDADGENGTNPKMEDTSKMQGPNGDGVFQEKTHLPQSNGSVTKRDGQGAQSGKDVTQYDPRKRDPVYSGADKSSLWEVVALSAHYHPSVSLFAKTVCQDMKPATSKGDPLKDFSLISFLDRFCYKKAKNRVAKSLYGRRSSRCRDDPVANSEQFQKMAQAGNVQEDDKFLVQFFNTNPDRVRKQEDDEPGEVSGSEIDSDDEEFEQAMRAEMGRLGADPELLAGPDVDAEGEDEVKAFEAAFAEDMVDSDGDRNSGGDHSAGDNGSDSDDGNVEGTGGADNMDDDSDDSEEDEGDDSFPSKGTHGKRGRSQRISSVFAAAEDYEEAIDKEFENAEKEEDDSPSEAPQKAKGRTAKRRIHAGGDHEGGRPGKKRRHVKRK